MESDSRCEKIVRSAPFDRYWRTRPYVFSFIPRGQIAAAHRLRESSSCGLTSMIQEHERPVGPMHLQGSIIPGAFLHASGAFMHARPIFEGLTVDAGNMLRNLTGAGGFLLAEAVMMGLASHTERNEAHDIVYAAASRALDSRISLRDALLADTVAAAHHWTGAGSKGHRGSKGRQDVLPGGVAEGSPAQPFSTQGPSFAADRGVICLGKTV